MKKLEYDHQTLTSVMSTYFIQLICSVDIGYFIKYSIFPFFVYLIIYYTLAQLDSGLNWESTCTELHPNFDRVSLACEFRRTGNQRRNHRPIIKRLSFGHTDLTFLYQALTRCFSADHRQNGKRQKSRTLLPCTNFKFDDWQSFSCDFRYALSMVRRPLFLSQFCSHLRCRYIINIVKHL